MLLFVLLVFSSCVYMCVCARLVWVCHEDRRRLIFLSLSSVLQSGEALSPAICLPALGIVIPKYRPVNISLVTATSPPQHTRKGKKKKKAEEGRRCSLLTILLCPFRLSLPLSHAESSSSFLSLVILLSRRCTMRGKKWPLFILFYNVICLIKHCLLF